MPTFAVSDVGRGGLYESMAAETSVRALLKQPVEALSCSAERLVSCDTTHALAKAALRAFYGHHPLVIRPDDVWFCIAQGFATHVRENAEALRSRFVTHSGKKKLVVERPDFALGQPNPWPEAFADFASQVGEHVGKLHELIAAQFSTTTLTEAAAFDVCLMDTFQGYFEYEMLCGCGIPEITLLGTRDDWASMVPRVRQLAKYGLESWCSTLVPVLEKLTDTAAGSVDADFWRSFFRYQSGSGPAELTGWLVALFPYLLDDSDSRKLVPNAYLVNWQERFLRADNRPNAFIDFRDVQGPDVARIPEGLASAPVQYVDLAQRSEHALRFVAGMFGVEQHIQTHALSVAFGWAILYDE